MKFEDRIKKVVEALEEDVEIMENIPAPQTVGAPQASNPSAVPGQNPQQQAVADATEGTGQGEVDPSQYLAFVASLDPNDPEVQAVGKMQPDEQWGGYQELMMKRGQGQTINPTGTSSAAPAVSNTSGTMGAGSTQV